MADDKIPTSRIRRLSKIGGVAASTTAKQLGTLAANVGRSEEAGQKAMERRQRITPRRKGSKWSKRNVERVRVLTEEGRMRPAGVAAFAQRQDAEYTFERPAETLPAEWEERFRASADAWAFFERQIPSYRKTCVAWVVGAKQEATRERRMEQLIECSARGEAPPPYKWAKLKK